jgi:hypothetical protein
MATKHFTSRMLMRHRCAGTRIRTPNELTASINHEPMPVRMSDPADFETWLTGSTEDAFKLARSYAAEQMRIVQSDPGKKDLLGAPQNARHQRCCGEAILNGRRPDLVPVK